ncbi:HisA/HisF-related TIM barrel protein [Shimia abyssi]|uniref:1-(5-phosphoribosyl)-5-[(5-phosphoribosylamino)methylideneamino] imidazole-4-carboxamide isomerase n=1 Tax=Shimia abyssi TaxID=1662395 RepID=A0A2P8FFS1_9RHOB|nr:1-(5-phosphoribosyl)-5-[(5-phosphoribosylamino)methylideneamino] imidazole-4-carboxamide isomerase [Shimia abyssi]PSL20566.1 1-(5-phosphoribosyl)-5-[(5-phosphoribosylamino)methylideneamino] imidazole-4-carboxamide isomerase [Shimia abyssi]
MIIYPTIELMGGKCVSLTRGRLDEPSVWHVDPVDMARGFAQAGASWMHVTDLDRISGSESDNTELVEEIIRAAGIPVQLGGGIRTREHAEQWIDKGAGRVVIGTAAIHDPALVRELAKYHPDQIVLAIDVYQGQLMSHGWQEASALVPADVLRAFDDAPLAGVIVTDIDSDIEDGDGSLGVITGLASVTRHPVIARGTVRAGDDISRLKFVPNIAGTLVGRALFSKDVDLAEALDLAQPEVTEKAEFI